MRWGLPPHTTKSTYVIRTCLAEVEVGAHRYFSPAVADFPTFSCF